MELKCEQCGSLFTGKNKRKIIICTKCIRANALKSHCTPENIAKKYEKLKYNRRNSISKINEKLFKKVGQEEYDSMISCGICGKKSHFLPPHIKKIHHMVTDEYKMKYGSVCSEKYSNAIAERLKGENNVWYNHGGKLSPFKIEFWTNKGLTIEEAQVKINETNIKARQNTPPEKMSNKIEYWLAKGYTQEEATKKLYERQAVGRYEKFIERYGEEEGKKKWQERQNKWQNTLKSKSFEERVKISRSKMCKNSYSKISQRLFSAVYQKIQHIYFDCLFATNDSGTIVDNGVNKEYLVNTTNGKMRYLDFYIPSINKCIEFDGDYYHSDKFVKGNKERDAIREQEIKDTLQGVQILHITEREYKIDEEATINKCVDFIMAKNET